MQKANHIITGIIAGLIFPAIAWFLVADRLNNISFLNKPAVPYLLAIAFNLILLRICYKKDAQNTGNGIILSTFIFMLVVFFIKLKH